MKNNVNRPLIWLEEFKNSWLSQYIPNDIDLVESIKTKLLELEQIIIGNTDDEEEYHRAKLLNDHSSSNSDSEQVSAVSTPRNEILPKSSLPTPLDIQLQLDRETEEARSRRTLLEQSDDSGKEDEKSSSSDENVITLRPSIRIERISQADAELYIPPAWKNVYSRRLSPTNHSSNNQKYTHRKQTFVSSNNDTSNYHMNILQDSSHSNTCQSFSQSKDAHTSSRHTYRILSNGNEKGKRKLSISDSDQTNISLRTRETNEMSTTSSTSDDDFTIKIRTQKSLTKKNERSPIELRKRQKKSHRSRNIIINHNPSTILNESSVNDSLTIVEDINPIDEDPILQDVIENKDNETIFGSLDIPQDKQMETNLDEDIDHNVESTSSNAIDLVNHNFISSPIQESSLDRPPVEVPSYAHLLADSKLSSDSDNGNEKKKLSKNQNKSECWPPSSPKSKISTMKKKSKHPIRQRVTFSSFLLSSDDNETDLESITSDDVSTASQNQSLVSSGRIRIQPSSTSSSEDSKNSNEVLSKRSKKRRRQSVASNERSNILKQLKRKRVNKKNLTSIISTDDNSNRDDYVSDSHIQTKRKTNEDDDNTTADDQNEEETSSIKQKHGRKNIRKIIDDKELHIQTKDAIEAERERRKRIADKQKEYNDSFLEQSSYVSSSENDQLNPSNHRLILEIDKTTNEPIIEVTPTLVKQLKPHQRDGIRFLWNNVFESIDAIKNKKHSGNGCILAHCMGLGKTLQVISFIHTIFNYEKITNIKTCLVLCPINAALNWSNEFDYWLMNIEPPIDHYQLTTVKPNLRISHVKYWYENGGVIIMGYEAYKRLANGFGIRNKELKAEVYKCLVDPGPDIVVVDEGHILKNAQTALAKCLSKIKTRRRIVLTGTPLQNNLIEYYCMVSFIKPNLLGSQLEYINRFVNPIQNGQHRDSNEEDVRLMKRRACVLHELLTGFIDRKDYSLLKQYLPPKFEYIINIRLSDLQSRLYEIYLKQQVSQEQRSLVLKKDFKSSKLFADYQYLQKIWTHPFLLYPLFIDRWKKQLNKDEDSLIDENELEGLFINDDNDGMLEKSRKKKKKKKSNKSESEPKLVNDYSGFLIDNIKDENEENQVTTSKITTRIVSNSSTTTLDSDSVEDDCDIIEDSDSDSKPKINDNNIEVIKSYPTRSRTTINNQQNNYQSTIIDTNVFDTENDSIPVGKSTDNDNNQDEAFKEPWFNDMREQFWFPFLDMLPKESKFDVELSGKFLLFKSILDKCAVIGDKVLLFSRSIYTLNYIENFLNHLHITNERLYQSQCESRRQLREVLLANGDDDDTYIPEPVKWIRDQDYFRMDGQTEITTRKRYAKVFNDKSNLRARLFLISTLAGGVGINLTGSNRVIVFDASWNPSHDTQAMFRSYRFGQKKPVYIYRFLAHGTMEEKIYQRQVVKQSISQRVVDDHQLDRHFTQNDIKELYKFRPEPLPEVQPTSTLLTESNTSFNYSIPKDHLLLDLLYEYSHWIHSYHSHDSLLENKIDESLTPEERRRALEEYENLKRLPDPRQIAIQRLQQQQQLNALIAQQQQLAAVQATRVYQQNSQKLGSEIYKSLQTPNGQNMNIARILQYIRDMEIVRKSTNNNVQQAFMNQYTAAGSDTVQHGPTAAYTTNIDSNDTILVESDDELGNSTISETPK